MAAIQPEIQKRLGLVLVLVHPEDREREAALATIRAVDLIVRRAALANISQQLGVTGRAQRRELPWYIGALMLHYRRMRSDRRKIMSQKQIHNWHKNVARAAGALLKLLKNERAIISRLTPSHYWPPEMIVRLEGLAAVAAARPQMLVALSKNEHLKLPAKSKPIPDLATINLVERLGYLYFAHTREEPGLTRNEYQDSKPGGPLFEIVKSVFELLGEPRTDEQIAMRISRRTPILGKRPIGKRRGVGV